MAKPTGLNGPFVRKLKAQSWPIEHSFFLLCISALLPSSVLKLSAMAEFAEKQTTTNGEQVEDEDYMGDLSQFLPPESENPPKSLSKKVNQTTCSVP